MKRCRAAFRVVVAGILVTTAALLAVLGAGCDDPTAALADITGASDVFRDHYHTVTILGRDILDPPPGGRTYTSSEARGHTHDVVLTETQLFDLQQRGAVVSLTSTPAPDPPLQDVPTHRHQFTFEH